MQRCTHRRSHSPSRKVVGRSVRRRRRESDVPESFGGPHIETIGSDTRILILCVVHSMSTGRVCSALDLCKASFAPLPIKLRLSNPIASWATLSVLSIVPLSPYIAGQCCHDGVPLSTRSNLIHTTPYPYARLRCDVNALLTQV